ncbi:XAC2610-related protein [Hymenobacter metallilatus]|uniref:VCBS repeat-containing protein n=1 Tax=Hymenobacter metallilatus TaxID=2493666 RepID=A0A3R9MYN4_9BACT|nr:hypothetical protein [Hymenobacter metallilatus]RSK33892.1 hypothetical protein EI290_09300 [Hymenobacter metallilatus]
MPRFAGCLLLLLLVCGTARAQRTYLVDDFSPAYFGKIYLADTAAVFNPGWVAVYDRKTRRQVLKVASEELALSLHHGRALANVQELPYGEQSLIISEDFNFDGRQDLALEDGQNSCYHGPSFQVYLATPTGFAHSAAFTRLAQEYCGMFRTDARARRLSTMTKSGCCWHEVAEYVVKNNAPFQVHRVEEDMMQYPFGTITEETWNGQRTVTHTRQTVDLAANNVQVLGSAPLPETHRRIVLFTTDGTTLHYALLRPDGTVEFRYPGPGTDEAPFELTCGLAVTTLKFRNHGAVYRFRETAATPVALEVQNGPAKRVLYTPDSTRAFLQPLRTLPLENVRKQ